MQSKKSHNAIDNFEKRIRSAIRVGIFIGIGFLTAIMLLTVANIIVRGLLGGVIHGAWELSGLILVVVAVFGMLYAELERSNIRIDILVSRLPQRTQEILEMFTSVTSLGIIAIILWATADWIIGGAFRNKSAVLGVPHLSFQIIWVSGLLALCLALLLDVLKALRRR